MTSDQPRSRAPMSQARGADASTGRPSPQRASRWSAACRGRASPPRREFAREREAVLFADWFCVGREESLAGPGDYLTADVAGESILIVRGAAQPGRRRAGRAWCRWLGLPVLQPVPAPRLPARPGGRLPAGRRRGPQRLRGHRDPLPLPRLDLRPRRVAALRAVPARPAPLPRPAGAAPGRRHHLGRVRLRPARRPPGRPAPAGRPAERGRRQARRLPARGAAVRPTGSSTGSPPTGR